MNTEFIYELSEKADSILQGNGNLSDLSALSMELKAALKPYNSGCIAIAQLNQIVGDIEYNAKKIMKYISFAENLGLEMIIFPELSLMGYPIGNTVERHPFLADENKKWLEEIAKFTKTITALVGFVEYKNGEFYNSLAILTNGKVLNTIRKSDSAIYSVNEAKYNILLSENITDLDSLSFDKSQVIVQLSNSMSRNGSENKKHRALSSFAKKHNTPIIYVNQVGAVDNCSFDGGSRVYNSYGTLLARAKFFEEQFLIVNPFNNIGKIYSSPVLPEKEYNETFSLDYEYDLERTYQTICQGIRDYFGKNGIKRACLGLSGGLDSTVCAVLLVDVLGKENVFGISMPSKITSKESKSDAEQLASNLGIGFAEVSIKDMVDTNTKVFDNLFPEVETYWNCRYKKSFTQDNIQARTRAMYLWGVSNEFESCIPIATSDKSEAYMGYATINGDMSGGFAPIADVTKTKLFALARWLNNNRKEKNVIPESIILKRPGAELAIDEKTGKPLKAEDALMPYEFLDEVIWRIENKHESYNDMINSEFLYERENSVPKEQKTQWLDKFFRRMSTALYKGSIMPPSVILDTQSINKYEYYQPITSSHINYNGTQKSVIREKLEEMILG